MHKYNGVEKLKPWLRIVSNIGFHISDVKRLLSTTTDWVIYSGAQHFVLHYECRIRIVILSTNLKYIMQQTWYISYICYMFYAIIMGKYRNTKAQKVQQSKEHYQKIDYKHRAWNYPLIFSLIKQFQAKSFFQENRESPSSIQDVYGEQICIIVNVNTQVTYNKMSVLNIVICALHVSIIRELSGRHLYGPCEDFMFNILT
jgi:hypothetical protein